MEITALEYIAHQVRRDIVRMVHQVQSGHPGGSLGCVEFFTALYFHLLEHTPASFDPNAENQDVFVLSNGHISPVYYSILARSGYFPTTELASFRRINSRLQAIQPPMKICPVFLWPAVLSVKECRLPLGLHKLKN